jgi:asparagine synthase (glutamine-hydrolysing)
MVDALAHRGPDGDGYFQDPNLPVFLGHRRLSIIDLEGGHQPMWNEDESVGVVFNGEIYNHAELRAELIKRGHVFRSDHSDTEVLVHGYEEWNSTLPRRLNGMFAFAIFDRPRQRLFLARDRFGEKPMFYSKSPGLFAFASELSSITRHHLIHRRLNDKALQRYFLFGYIPAPTALYHNCYKLLPGAHLTFEIATEHLQILRYWQFTITPDENLNNCSEEVLAEELRHLILTAVRRRLISDVPLGVFLSGGIDSSTVLAAATRLLPSSTVQSFTVGFTEPSFDESLPARNVATALNTKHHEEILDLSSARGLLNEVLTRLDEPLGDASLIPTYMLSRFTRKTVTVALAGDGADELFAGYDPFRALAPAQLYARFVPDNLHRGLRRLADLLPLSPKNMSLDFKIRRSLCGLSYGDSLWNPVWHGSLEPAHLEHLFEEPLKISELLSDAIELWQRDPQLDYVDRTLEFYTNFYLPGDILTKVDRAAMLCSLESRAVFLDNDLVEFCQRLPHRFKYRNGKRKYLLKKAIANLIPGAVLKRSKKGFGIPLAKWLCEWPEPKDMCPIDGMKTAFVRNRWIDHRLRRADHRLFLWSWLSLQNVLYPSLSIGSRHAGY